MTGKSLRWCPVSVFAFSVACLSGPVMGGISTAPSRQGLFLLREAWPHATEASVCVNTFILSRISGGWRIAKDAGLEM
ncbi:hypothetical protein K456DRAFT_148152 [Colletotrichum gloeosporioides 23]|nr:hypothetical protein K456DRAFT_148152 [Colletotrichum gloeosporioides 23]